MNKNLHIKCNNCNYLNPLKSNAIKDRVFAVKCFVCKSYLINDGKVIVKCNNCKSLNRFEIKRISDKPICGICKKRIIEEKKYLPLFLFNILTIFNISIAILIVDYYLNRLAFKYGHYLSVVINLLSDLNINNDYLIFLYKKLYEFNYADSNFYLIGLGLTFGVVLIIYIIGKSFGSFRCFTIPLLLIIPIIILYKTLGPKYNKNYLITNDYLYVGNLIEYNGIYFPHGKGKLYLNDNLISGVFNNINNKNERNFIGRGAIEVNEGYLLSGKFITNLNGLYKHGING